MMLDNAYMQEVSNTLPRLIAWFDTDTTSKSYGMGDRYYWAWGLIDFSNGTFQGAVHGMARLWVNNLWPYPTSERHFLSRLDAMVMATGNLTRKDGSLEEAFPNEGSYCVTALVAFDLLCALDLLKEILDDQTQTRWQRIIGQLINYLLKHDETHAIISNHLATAVAALVRWHQLTGESKAEIHGKKLLDRILSYQSKEGWFKEYEGPDPGYQSLCTYYLADVHLVRPDWKLLEPLRASIQFLTYFAHPDGSFGGIYGSRCTRFFCPAGILALANEIPEAAGLSRFMRQSIAQQRTVCLSSIDAPNFVPFFNAYCWAASLFESMPKDISDEPLKNINLPALNNVVMRQFFSESGLLIDAGEGHYTVVSTRKGGVVYHFVNQKLACINTGVVIENNHGQQGSSQAWDNLSQPLFSDNTLEITSIITEMPKKNSTLLQFIILRILCTSVFRIVILREWIKQRLVRLLITAVKKWPITNTREIHLGKALVINDKQNLSKGYSLKKNVDEFIAIHMASQGYWQMQDEEEMESKP